MQLDNQGRPHLPETNFFIARESLNDLRKYTVPSVMEVFQSWGINFADYGKFNGMDNFFQFNNGSRVPLLQAGYMPSDAIRAVRVHAEH